MKWHNMLYDLLRHLAKRFGRLSGWIVGLGTIVALAEWYIIYKSSTLIGELALAKENGDVDLASFGFQQDLCVVACLFVLSIFANRSYLKSCVRVGENFISDLTFLLANSAPFDGPRASDRKYVELIVQKAFRVSEGIIIPLLAIFPRTCLVGLIAVFLVFQLGATVLLGVAALFSFYFVLVLVQRFGVVQRSATQKNLKQKKFEYIVAIFSSRRDYSVSGVSPALQREFEEIDRKYSSARGENQFRGILPRVIIENSIPFFIIAATLMVLFWGIETALFSFGAAALMRVIPAFQQIYSSINSIMNDWSSLESVQAHIRNTVPSKQAHLSKAGAPELNGSEISIALERSEGDVVRGTMKRGQVCFLLGPSGSGKSTLINSIAGFRKFDNAVVQRPAVLKIQIIEQTAEKAIFEETLRLGKTNSPRVREYIAQFGLSQIVQVDAKLSNYFVPADRLLSVSGGEWQRLNLLAKLSRNADILILDEAINGIAEVDQIRLLNFIQAIVVERNMFCLIVSHLKRDRLFEVSENVICL